MGKFEQSAMVAVCGVLEEIVMAERVRSSTASGGEREKIGRKEKRVGPATVKTGTYKKIESGFESSLDSKTAEGVNSNLSWDSHKIQVGISILI
jgi:hypothetical protein